MPEVLAASREWPVLFEETASSERTASGSLSLGLLVAGSPRARSKNLGTVFGGLVPDV